jgi:hypothetical protein
MRERACRGHLEPHGRDPTCRLGYPQLQLPGDHDKSANTPNEVKPSSSKRCLSLEAWHPSQDGHRKGEGAGYSASLGHPVSPSDTALMTQNARGPDKRLSDPQCAPGGAVVRQDSEGAWGEKFTITKYPLSST